MTSESALGMFIGIENHGHIIWVWPGFSTFGHGHCGYCYDQSKCKLIKRGRVVHRWMQN